MSFLLLYILIISLKNKIMENNELEIFNHLCLTIIGSTFITIFL